MTQDTTQDTYQDLIDRHNGVVQFLANHLKPLDIELAYGQCRTLLGVTMWVDANHQESQLKVIDKRTTFLMQFATTLCFLEKRISEFSLAPVERGYWVSSDGLQQMLGIVSVMQSGAAVYGHDDARKAREAFERGDCVEIPRPDEN